MCTSATARRDQGTIPEEWNAIDVVEGFRNQWPAPAGLHYVLEGTDGRLLPVG